MSDQLSLSTRYSRALSASSRLSTLSALSLEYKQISESALADLKLVTNAIGDLQLFSKNETLEDVSTRQLVYISAPYATAELLQSLPSAGTSLRSDILTQAKLELQKFAAYIVDYGIINGETLQAAKRSAQLSDNATKRREEKIQQYREEKQIRSKIQALRSRNLSTNIDEPVNNYDAIRALLTSSPNTRAEPADSDDDADMDDEMLRELSILLLQLLFIQANTILSQISQELQLLKNQPSLPISSAQSSNQTQDNTWRLDQTSRGGPDGRGPLMDAKGRPQRPFTIMPAGQVVERTRLQSEVFRPDYRLPTMTIDEYLAEEERRGNIIQGGGKASEEAPTSSEQLAIDAEQDGTHFGEEKYEEKRLKDESWAIYTDANPKGMGNTMNRG